MFADLEIDEYQAMAHQTSIQIDTYRLTPNQIYALKGLPNEAGEVGGLGKKAMRGDFGENPAENPEFLAKLEKELGDVAWYLAEIATQFHMSLQDVFEKNLQKLGDRAQRGVLMGSGDDR